MTERGTFGRRGVSQLSQSSVSRDERSEPFEPGPKLASAAGWLVAGCIGVAICAGVFAYVRTADNLAPPIATAPTVVKTAQSIQTCIATRAEFDALETGASLAKAMSIIGCKGSEFARVSLAGIEMTTLRWQGNGGEMSRMVVSFDNDRLSMKAQMGLE